jgi:hypothetical protein
VAREFDNPDLDPSQDPLWHRIDAFDLDALDVTLPFSRRLARDNCWTHDYAARVIEEYKRFCYLSVRAGHAVAPSDQIDQAWRLHLSFSRQYWDEFCTKVLCADLHHSPPLTSDLEDAGRHRASYAATMKSYQRMSGAPPPADIWPNVAQQFSDAVAMRRVNTADYMIIRRPPKGLLWIVQIALVLATLYSLLQGEYTLALVVGLATAAVAIYRDRTDNKWTARPRRDGDDG